MIAQNAVSDPTVAPLLATRMESTDFTKLRVAERERIREEARLKSEADRARFAAEDKARRYCVVYYCQIRPGMVKIGTTTNLRSRMTDFRLNDADVLAAEPGSYKTESMRHRQFAAQRINPQREDFTLDAELQAHIDQLVTTYGKPFVMVDTIIARQRILAESEAQS